MKSYFLFALLLIGCSPWRWHDNDMKPPQEYYVPPPAIIARGTDGNIGWTCQVEELNDKLVWIPCEFENAYGTSYPSGTCLSVSFYDNVNLDLVVRGRKVCSGPMGPFEKKTNYAAFIKEKRQTLQRCGELLDLCVMLAGAENK